MRKKLYLVISLVIFVVFVSSCSSDSQFAVSISDKNVSQEEIAMNNLLDSIEVLNAKYPSSHTRGSFFSGGAVGLADAAGWAAGAGIGRWVGGAAGSLGGPATAVLGAFVGGRVGPYVCTFLASGAANFLCSRKFLRSATVDEKDFQFVGLVTNEDSIGYYHNIMMTKLNEDKNKYVSLSDSVDYGLIYQDIANYLREIGRYDEILEDSCVKENIINQIKSICLISEKYKTSSDCEELVAEQCNYLKDKCTLPENDIKTYRDFSVRLYNKCISLPNGQLEDYSKDLNVIIEKSTVSTPVKRELSLSADLTINSALYWQINN